MGEASQIPRRVWGGTGLLAVGRVWGSACTLVSLFLLARQLPEEGFGRLTFYLALFLVLDSLVDLGTGQLTVQRTAASPESVPSVLATARRVRLAAGLLGCVLVGGGALLAGEPGAGWILLATLYPLTHALELSTLVFKNQIAWGRPVLVRAGASTASLGFVLLLWSLDVQEPALYLLAIAAGSTLGNLGLHLVARPHLPGSSGVAPAPLWPFLAAAIPMGAAGLCQQLYFYVDNLFIRYWLGDVALGHYNVAVRVMSYSIMIAVYAPLAALPWLTREHGEGRLGAAVAGLAQPLFAVAGVGAGLAWPLAGPLLGLFGPGFPAAEAALQWLLVASAVVYPGASLLTSVVAAGRTRAVLWIALSGLLVNLLGNLWAVPRLGIEGAALTTLGTELTVVAAAVVVLVVRGAPPAGRHPLRWLWGPAAFALARWLSASLTGG